ncbi:acyltransferase [Granulicella mallensis]|uniref:Peptidoglycan/LPS O-acetylase OafA/YrhL n=1 Tax=Granulicella mallensis TaxID=940614 RepID=A0A7W8E7L2_9BACT|nr:acyltransferase [Granulicella mallensis]MBB5062433.1 peptidoglycan/LPS O-acetylase OafA/YrhL [Granulicella mallensis]
MTNVVVNPATPPEHHRFHFLDALRGLAAILVIMRHSPPVYAQSFVTENSFLAVDFFFCLSGFVIAFSYEQRLSTFLTFKNFFVARLIRLYPIAAIGTVVGAVELALQLHLHAPVGTFIFRIALETALGLLVLPSARYVLFPLDRVMWTLFFELIANLLYAVLVRRRLATTGFLVILVTLAAIALTGERLHLGTLDRGYTFDSAYVGFSRVSLSFLLGVLTFRLYRHQARARLLVGPSILAATAITFVFVLALCGPPSLTHNAAPELVLLLLLFPLIVYYGAHVSVSSRWTPLCAFLGTISYPLYVLHPPMLWPLTLSQLSASPTPINRSPRLSCSPTPLGSSCSPG